MKKFGISATVMLIAVAGFGLTSQVANDRTMENCTVNFSSNPFNNVGKSSVLTSCGYVYVAAHTKNGLNFNAITEMNEALHSGKRVNIKATGIGIASAYEITVAK